MGRDGGIELRLSGGVIPVSGNDCLFDPGFAAIDVLAIYLAFRAPFVDTPPEKLAPIIAFSPYTVSNAKSPDSVLVTFGDTSVSLYSFMGREGDRIRSAYRRDLIAMLESEVNVLGYGEFTSAYGYLVVELNDEAKSRKLNAKPKIHLN